MNRRTILKTLGVSAPLIAGCSTQQAMNKTIYESIAITPPHLKKGDTVGLISPGSSLSEKALQKCVENIESLGFQVKTGKYWDDQYGYLAARDKNRVEDIHDMFADDEVNAIWCARGGYGCTRLLPLLDFELIKQNPKILIGYSDITALLNPIFINTGLMGFHGPVASSDFTKFAKESMMQVLSSPSASQVLANHAEHGIDVITKGKGTGRLVGGNLSVLVAMCGTPYEVDMTDKLVFFEDVGEKPYRIDRMLTQLLQSSGLSDAAGIIIGICKGCEAKEGDRSLTLRECFVDRLADIGIPVVTGYSFGHISDQFTIPVGAMASLNTDKEELEITVPVVI